MADGRSILVVGGAGYLGCVLVEELLARGYGVTIFDRLFFGRQGLEKVKDRIRVIAGDVRAMPPSALDDVRAVVNLSGLSNDPTAEYNPDANFQMNTVATRILGEMAKKRGIRRYIFASSCSVYDVGVVDEERDVLLNEESAVAPRAVYAVSKLQGERELLSLKDDNFSPVILRMGTLFGFSPRMRYDLVVNTMVKDGLSKGRLNLHFGGQMWRPLTDVRDAARSYICALESDVELTSGRIYNVVTGNYRISELALRIQSLLAELGYEVKIDSQFEYRGIRNYRVSGNRIQQELNFKPLISLDESVRNIVHSIQEYGYEDFDNDRYYNIRWMKLLEEAKRTIDITGSVFEMPTVESPVNR
jgi:nucleoside-diphosphate-sugar epimerase